MRTLSFLARRADRRGFTLMELLIVIAIIAILAVAFVPNALKAPAKARDVVRIKRVQDVQTAVESHLAETGQIVASDGGNCLDAAAVTMGLDSAPTDSALLNSCESQVNPVNSGAYYYRSVTAGAERFYIIAAKVEVATSGNSKASAAAAPAQGFASLNTPATLADAKALVQEGLADANYFVAVGPR